MSLYSLQTYFFFIFIFSNTSVYAETENQDAYVLYLENDSRNIGGPGSDQSYTNGIKFSYIYAQGEIPKWSHPLIDRLEILDQQARRAKVNFGLSLGHQIFTPNDTQTEQLVLMDRPYAAWLYVGFAISLKEKYLEHFLELGLGTVGPSALGEQVQNSFHRLIHVRSAKGWSHGLKDEPTLQLFYQKRNKFIFSNQIDLIPFYGVGLGNAFINAHAGGMIRLGLNLPDDFGASRPSASDGNSFISLNLKQEPSKLSYYFFTAARGNYVVRNIFLDGNSYQKSHSVRKKSITFDTELGFSLKYDSKTLVWRFVTKSPEFDQKKDITSFASLSFLFEQ